MKTDAEMVAIEARLLELPAVSREVERYRPVVAKLTNESLVAIGIAVREESRRRAGRRPVGIGNRG
jgi:hypothetical protein